MDQKICAIIPQDCYTNSKDFVNELKNNKLVNQVIVFGKEPGTSNGKFLFQKTDGQGSSSWLKQLVKNCKSDYLLLVKDKTSISLGQFAIERFLFTAVASNAGMVYSNFFEKKAEETKPHPVIDYQQGSLRDDFNFGSLLFCNTSAVKHALSNMGQEVEFSSLYYLRLKISQTYQLVRIPEFLYSVAELDLRKSGEAIFDYVDPRNQQKQLEAEKIVTEHLKDVGAYLKPKFKEVDFNENGFKVKASVVIPVKNRAKTVKDAVGSVLNQKTDFDFNLIVIDNYSNDGTTELLKELATSNSKLIHHIPQRKDLGIGGCWNEGVQHANCGMFAVQLDSDDIYKDDHTLQKIVDAFYEQKCAMVVGTYQLVNFDLEELPPGIIDHKEWTPENGRNNALRINGLGAPRAFYTPILRELKIPNVSYGEDYAIGLAISRDYQIGRVYENLYLCRRWEENSDAALDIEKQNKNNQYKDWIRTMELQARKKKEPGTWKLYRTVIM